MTMPVTIPPDRARLDGSWAFTQGLLRLENAILGGERSVVCLAEVHFPSEEACNGDDEMVENIRNVDTARGTAGDNNAEIDQSKVTAQNQQ
jgi:hypothetical protein